MSHRAHGTDQGRVVVGVHTSLSGLHALRLAVAEARARGAALHAVRAWGPASIDQPAPDTTWQPALGLVRQSTGEPSSEAGAPTGDRDGDPTGRSTPAALAAAIVDQAFAETMGAEPDDVAVRTVLVPDQPGPVLVEYASRDRDLLVIGAGRRGFPWRPRGSAVVRYCLRRASCPVLVVPPPPLTRVGSPRALLRALRRDIEQLTDLR